MFVRMNVDCSVLRGTSATLCDVMFIAICVVVNVKVNLDNQRSLDVVHRLFESVSSSVFRPVDIVLKTLFIDSSSVVSMLTVSLKLFDVAEA